MSSSAKIDQKNVQEIWALTSMQEGMLYHHMENPQGQQYFEQVSVTISGKVDDTTLTRAWNHLLTRNEALRTVFAWKGLKDPVQIVLKEIHSPLTQHDISEFLDPAEKQRALVQVKNDDLNAKFDLETGPLVRLTACKLSDEKYELILSYHHIVFDGWSLGTVLKELFTAYDQIAHGETPTNTRKTSFSRYLKWLKTRDIEKEKQYWQNYLVDFETKSSLPIDYHHSVDTVNVSKLALELPSSLMETVTAFAKNESLTVSSIFHTCWGILLQRCNNTNDVLFGTSVSGRPAVIPEMEEMVGLFINTLPVRLTTDQDERVIDALKKINQNSITRNNYENLPLVEIQSLTGMKSTLFDSLLVVENYPLEMRLKSVASALHCEGYSIFEATNYPLTIVISLFEEITLNFIYNGDVFATGTVAKLGRLFVNILEQMVENPSTQVAQIDLLSAEEKAQLLCETNSGAWEFLEEKTILQLFEEQTTRFPERIAIMSESGKLTYGQLNDKANQLGRILVSRGVQKDSIVAIMVEPSPNMLIGIMAVLKAGGAYLPLTPGLPEERIHYILADSKTTLLLTESKFVTQLSLEIGTLDLNNPQTYDLQTSNLHLRSYFDDPAYVIYTSGSTGQPKGVMIQHGALVSTLSALQQEYPLSSTGRWLLKTTFMFDVSLTEIFGWIIGGGSLAVLEAGAEKDPQRILEAIQTYSITHINFVPSMLNTFVEHLEITGEDGRRMINQLKYIMIAGEAISTAIVKRLNDLNIQVPLINLYGPTETTIYATHFPIRDVEQYRTIPIGKGFGDTKLYVLDRDGNLQPQGFVGELCIGGHRLAASYLNQPELSAAKFSPNPFSPGERMYHTGDLVRWLSDDNLEFLGRVDDQLKVRGYRIEPGEIENHLFNHPFIKEVVVVVRESAADKSLIAYYVSENEIPLKELRDYLKEKLPTYMIPDYFMRMDQMPLTASGKINRRALPEFIGKIESQVEYLPPVTDFEVKMSAIWSDLLGIETIGVNDNFFLLGGHSLKATRLAARVFKEFGVELPVKGVFEHPTVRSLSQYIKHLEQNEYLEITKSAEQEYYPVSSAQKRLLLFDQLRSGQIAYNMSGALEIKGKLDKDLMQSVLQTLVNRHESLRTSFTFVEGEPVQKIQPHIVFHPETATIKDQSGIAMLEEFVRPFDLSTAPLLRAKLVECSKDQYLLLIDLHHIIADGISLNLLLNELIDLYQGNELPELKIQYKDFVVWQNQVTNSQKMKNQEKFWLDQFSGEIPVLNLPTDYVRPASVSYEGGQMQFVMDEHLSSRIKNLAKEENVTLFMVLLAAYNVLLARYSGQEEIIVGSPIAGRQHTDVENIVGMFVNTLAHRNYPTRTKTFMHFLQEVQASTISSFDNQDYQFEKLIERLEVERDVSRNPLFDVMFVLQNYDAAYSSSIQNDGLTFSLCKLTNKITKFDLTLTVVDGMDRLECMFEYRTDLFKPETIGRMSRHYVNILQSVLEDRMVQLRAVELLTEEEKELLLGTWNDTEQEFTGPKTLHQLFEEQVWRTPDHPALVFQGQEMTYSQLNRRANQVARALREKGVGPGTITAVLLESSFEMAIALIAIVKAGSAFLPIDPAEVRSRREYKLTDSKAILLLTNEEIAAEAGYSGEWSNMGDENLFSGNSENLANLNHPDDLAYIIYTSGSTGNPKGVMIEHQSVVNLLLWRKDAYNVDETDVSLQLLSYAFDGFIAAFFTPLIAGSKIVLMSPGENQDPFAIKKYMKNQQVTQFIVVPSLFRAILDCLDGEEIESVQKVVLAGEQVTQSLVEKGRTINKHIELINEYGPTENTVLTTFERNLQNVSQITIGQPIANSRVYVLDRDHNLVPVGVPGELCIAGIGLALGYLNRPDLTAEKFVDWSGQRIYKTGDLVRWCADGKLQFLGRIDHQVKIRGYRIELAEIETQIRKYPGIQNVVVVPKTDHYQETYLCCYYEGNVDVSALKSHLRNVLPEYMIPVYFIELEKMPVTFTGKINHNALPEPVIPVDLEVKDIEYANETEERLATIWAELLGIEATGVDSDFFKLGGHSLKATILVTRIYKELNVELSVREVFTNPTIRQLAEIINSKAKHLYSAIEPIGETEESEFESKHNRRGLYPTSSAQKRMFFLHKLRESDTGYNIPGAMIVEGSLKIKALELAFTELIHRHESLRTSFEMVDLEPMQKIHPEIDFTIDHQTVNDPVNLESIVSGFIRPFDLEKAPLLRVGLVKLPVIEEGQPERHLIIFDMHHIISDGVSMNILKQEMVELYQGKQLPGLRVQYKDFAVWQNKFLTSETILEQETYWLEQMSDKGSVLNLFTDYSRRECTSSAGDQVDLVIETELATAMNKLAIQHGATLYMLLLAAYTVLLAKYSGQEDIVIGSPIAGRSHPDLEHIIGMFVNTLAMRNYPVSNKTFADFLAEVTENAVKAYDNQDYQFEMLIEKLDIRLARDEGRNPLFDVMFVLQNIDEYSLNMGDLRFTPYHLQDEVSKFDLTLSAQEIDGRIQCSFKYKTGLFKRSTIEQLSRHFLTMIESIVSDPEQKLAEIEMMTSEEKEQLLSDFNGPALGYPRDKTIHQLFAEQVVRTPSAIAVKLDDEQMTYEQLHQRSNQLARNLRAKGVTTDTIVGIMTESSFEMITGIIAILKAGGAYLPLDPEYPAERVSYILTDSGAKIILTQTELLDKIDSPVEIINVNDHSAYSLQIENLENISHSNNLAYVIYTSGSTGQPKGVMIEHWTVMNQLIWFIQRYRLWENTNILQIANYIFDASVQQIFATLTHGATLCLIRKAVKLNKDLFIKYISEKEIHILNMVPTLIKALLVDQEKVESVRIIISGGEELDDNLKNELIKKGYELHNHYGPTETTIECLISKCSVEEKVVLGKLRPNLRCYILDKHQRLVPGGIVGEIYIAGDCLARGYLNRPELTREKFVADPFVQGERMYRTGDLGRWLPDGNVEFCGRQDHQVKIRGYRIELGEIENQLLTHEDIHNAVVIVKEDEKGFKNLYGFLELKDHIVVETKEDAQKVIKQVKNHLKTSLPEYMIPSFFAIVSEIPTTYSGKVDRQRLQSMEVEAVQTSTYAAPTTKIENALARLFTGVLGVEQIGIDSDFFELGGHSLKATALISLISKELHVDIPLKQVFDSPTIRELAHFVETTQKSNYTPIKPVEKREYYPLSSAQRRLFIMGQMAEVETSYNMPETIMIKGDLNIQKLQDVFQRVIQRHEILRTSFEIFEDEPGQKIQSEVDFAIEYHELNLMEGDSEERICNAAIKDFIRPFDLGKPPLLRVGLFKLQANTYLCIFDMHHIISDGVSMSLMVEEVLDLYQNKELPEPTVQYKDFTIWQNDFFNSEKIKEQGEYWLHRFKGDLPVLNLPLDYERPLKQQYEGDTIYFQIDQELTGALKECIVKTQTTMYIMLLAVYNVLLLKYTGQEDIIIGSPIAGRTHPDLEHVMGMFVNMLCMRNYPDKDKTFGEFLQEVKQNSLDAYANQDYQYEELVRSLGIKRDTQSNPVFCVVFAMQNFERKAIALQEINVIPFRPDLNLAKFDLLLDAMEDQDEIKLSLNYKTSLFTRSTAEEIARDYLDILKQVMDHLEIRLKEIAVAHQYLCLDSKEVAKQIDFDF